MVITCFYLAFYVTTIIARRKSTPASPVEKPPTQETKEKGEKHEKASEAEKKAHAFGKTPLHIACTYGQLSLVEEHLKVIRNNILGLQKI